MALLLGMQLDTQNGAVLCASGTGDDRGKKCRQSPLLPEKIYLSPLHIKLGLMENFVNGMDKTGRGLLCVRNKLPNVSDAKQRRVHL